MSVGIRVPYADYELESAQTLMGTLAGTAGVIEDAAQNLRVHWRVLPAVLSGSSVSTSGFYTAMEFPLREAEELAGMLRGVWKALNRYVDEAEYPLSRLRLLRDEVAQWHSTTPHTVDVVPGMAEEDLWALQAGFTPGTVCMGESPWVAWNAQRERLESDVRYWTGEYQRASQGCVTALRHVKDPSVWSWWTQFTSSVASGRYEDFGVSKDQRSSVEAIMLVGRLVDGNLDQAGTTRLEQLLVGLSTSPKAAATFWTAVGGTRALGLLMVLDQRASVHDDGAGSAHSLVLAVRESLSAGTQQWDAGQATSFVDAMWEGMGRDNLSLHAVSFLFNRPDQYPMGLEFTVAVANKFDSWERNPAGAHPGPAFSSGARGGLIEIAQQESIVLGHEPEQANDPMGRVFSTLALTHDASLHWFTEPGDDSCSKGQSTGAARIEYWFGQRPWHQDHFTGIAATWDSAMLTHGGVHSADTTSDVYKSQTELTSHIFHALGRRDDALFGPDLLSDPAAESMAKAISGALPWLVETAGTAGDAYEGSPTAVEVQFFEAGAVTWMPSVHGADAAKVWGTVGGNDHGLFVLSEAVYSYQIKALAFAIGSDQTGATWENALERFMKLDGFHQGSVGGVQELQARIRDEKFSAVMDKMSLVADLVPLPAASKLPEVGAWALNAGVPLVSSGAGEAAISTWGDDAATAVAESNTELLAGLEVNDRRLEVWWNSDAMGLRESFPGVDFKSWRNGFRTDYSHTYLNALVMVDREGVAQAFEEARTQ